MRRVAALAVAVLTLCAFRGSAAAEPPTTQGWWWQAGSISVAPPVVAEGGLWVANHAGDAVAISAVSSARSIQSILVVIDAAFGSPSVRACPATPGWKPAQGGAWDARPDVHCERGEAPARATTDGTGLVFDVGALRTTSIALVPAEGADPFSVTFKPTNEFTVRLVAPASDDSTSPTAAIRRSSSGRTEIPASSAFGGFDPALVGLSTPTTEPASIAALPRIIRSDAPSTGGVIGVTRRVRQPAALLVAVGLLAVWAWRVRTAERDAADHVLAQPLGHTGGLDAATSADAAGSGTR